LVATKSNASLGEILKRKKSSKSKSGENNKAWHKERRPPPTTQEEKDKRKEQIELVFDCERPGMRKGGAAAEPDVLDGRQKFPERKNLRILAPSWQEKVDRENNKISRQDAQGAPSEEPAKLNVTAAGERREELSADQVTAENKEEIDADPAETIEAARDFESEKRGVINRDYDDCKAAKKIETRLALTSREARVDLRSQK
jgi:hypothetical protein